MHSIKVTLLVGVAAVLGSASATFGQELVTYPIPQGIDQRERFEVRARVPGGEWRPIDCYRVEVDMHKPRPSSMAYFDFTGEVEVAVRDTTGSIDSARIRPLSYAIVPDVKSDELRFSLSEPRNLSIEVGGDIFDNLQLFAGAIPDQAPNPNDPDVMYFGPGVHEPGERIDIPSGATVYLAGGAVVKSVLSCINVHDVRIVGRGVLYQADRGVEIDFSRNVIVDGITVVNPRHYSVRGGQSRGIHIRDVKSFSSKGWSDGIDMMSCQDVVIDGVFLRNSDDCFALYAHRWDYYGDTRDVTLKNSTLWADVAHPINMGTHGNPEKPETIESVRISNIDILNHDEPQIGYQGCIAMNASDENLIRDVLIENVRIEDFERGQLLNLRVTFNKKYATAPGRGIENIVFRDVTYSGENAELSIISGYNEKRGIRNIVFENLTINGRLIWDKMPGKPGYFKTSDLARFHVGAHVHELEFRRNVKED